MSQWIHAVRRTWWVPSIDACVWKAPRPMYIHLRVHTPKKFNPEVLSLNLPHGARHNLEQHDVPTDNVLLHGQSQPYWYNTFWHNTCIRSLTCEPNAYNWTHYVFEFIPIVGIRLGDIEAYYHTYVYMSSNMSQIQLQIHTVVEDAHRGQIQIVRVLCWAICIGFYTSKNMSVVWFHLMCKPAFA